MKRDQAYDILKGVAIILMVLAHAMEPQFCSVRKWINLFHMPVFFLVAGWFYKESGAESLRACLPTVGKKAARLWWPFVLWGGMFVMLHDVFLSMHIYSDDPSVGGLLSGTELASSWGWDGIVSNLKRVPWMQGGDGGGGWRFLVLAHNVLCEHFLRLQ